VGTAYRQRSQILVFYFIFVAVGFVLMKERQEDNVRRRQEAREAELAALRALRPAPAPARRQMTLPPTPARRGVTPPRGAAKP
jgi:hypothetical protein